jgi:hypothetical protein
MFEDILLRYKVWCFALFPLVGYVIGFVLQLMLGTHHNQKYEGIMIHIITVILMSIIFIDIAFDNNILKDVKSKFLYIAVNYLFVLGVVLGLMSKLF